MWILCSSLRITGHLPAAIVNGRGYRLVKMQFSELQTPVTLTLDRVIWHTVVHHSSTSVYTINFTEIGKTFSGRTYGRMYLLMDGHFPL